MKVLQSGGTLNYLEFQVLKKFFTQKIVQIRMLGTDAPHLTGSQTEH